ncbi:hypothetical protein GCM10010199_11790 [Dactylosporangium roseum]
MPLVYVHGVGNRWDDGYQRRSEQRDGLFRQFVFPVIGADPAEAIRSPFWGDLGGHLRWSGSSFPTSGSEAFGDGEADLIDEIAATELAMDSDRFLVTVAHRDLADAVDLLFSVCPMPVSSDDIGAAAVQLVAYCTSRARAVPDGDSLSRHPWLAEVEDDEDLIEQLLQHSTGWSLDQHGDPRHTAARRPAESLSAGGGAWLNGGLRLVRRAAIGAPMSTALHVARAMVGERATTVAADALVYLSSRGDANAPGGIVQRVADAVEEAARKRTDDRPLVVVAHSLGGLITYDVLSHYRPDLTVDVLVTVGSQVGLFAELGLLRSSDPSLPTVEQPRIDVPPNIRRWLNVVDRADVLAFRAEPVFRAVRDFVYPSAAVWAHGAYFRQPHFHARLAQRILRGPR